jgi:hypothetical protein
VVYLTQLHTSQHRREENTSTNDTNLITSECAQVEIIILERSSFFDPMFAYSSDKQVGRIAIVKLIHEVSFRPIRRGLFQNRRNFLFVSTDRVTIKGGVIDLKLRNSMFDFGVSPLVNAIPTAPDECTFSLRNRVTGLPVMNGVEDAIRPSFEYIVGHHFNPDITLA